MQDLLKQISTNYLPTKAFVVFRDKMEELPAYVESYDMDSEGKPVNPHPLSAQECGKLAKILSFSSQNLLDSYTPKYLIPSNVIRLDVAGASKCVFWFTKPQSFPIKFAEKLDIPSGTAHMPALLWSLNDKELSIFAIKLDVNRPPNINCELFESPFFNIHPNARVCMGTVDTDGINASCLEELIEMWQNAFWNSYFSHSIKSNSPILANMVEFWSSHVNTNKPFPNEILISENLFIKDLIK